MSTQRRIYLDFNATVPLAEAARSAMGLAMTETGNPSSVHAEGRRARDRVERARAQVATLMGRPREQIVFTSGGTEGNALGVVALASQAEIRGKPRRAYFAGIDHPSLVGAVRSLVSRGWEVRALPMTAAGVVGHTPEAPDVPDVDSGFGLVAVSLANHELGTLPDVAELLGWARAHHAFVHVDAVQAAGKRDLGDLASADAVVISGHKLGGPQGVGALAIAIDEALPLIEAGHQERGRRPGTENTLGIVGFGAAAAALELTRWAEVASLGDRLEAGLRAIEGVRIHGEGAPRIGGTINAGFRGTLGESIVIALDLEGVAVSTGAACTSGSVQPSPVLLALGMSPADARQAVRFSLGRTTTAAEIDRVLAILPAIVSRARAHGL